MALFVLYQCLLLDRLHIYEQCYLKGQPRFHLDVARKDLVITTKLLYNYFVRGKILKLPLYYDNFLPEFPDKNICLCGTIPIP